MSKGQAERLSKQHEQSGGPKGIFGRSAQTHDDAVKEASKSVFKLLKKAFPEFTFRHRYELTKKEINDELKTIDSQLGKTLCVKNAKIKPDGGIIEVKDKKGKWRIILVAEAKHQGKDVENIKAGKKVGKNKDQDLMVAGNAIERVHKNINEIRNIMLTEKHFPYIVFLQGSNFSIETLDVLAPNGRHVKIKHDSGAMNRIDRVTAANYSMSINKNHCKNIFININGFDIMLQSTSIYTRCDPWEQAEMIELMVKTTETSLNILWEQLEESVLKRIDIA